MAQEGLRGTRTNPVTVFSDDLVTSRVGRIKWSVNDSLGSSFPAFLPEQEPSRDDGEGFAPAHGRGFYRSAFRIGRIRLRDPLGACAPDAFGIEP